jgi:hypothetical protein
LSFADIDLDCLVEFSGWINQSIPEHCGHLKAWHERVVAELA